MAALVRSSVVRIACWAHDLRLSIVRSFVIQQPASHIRIMGFCCCRCCSLLLESSIKYTFSSSIRETRHVHCHVLKYDFLQQRQRQPHEKEWLNRIFKNVFYFHIYFVACPIRNESSEKSDVRALRQKKKLIFLESRVSQKCQYGNAYSQRIYGHKRMYYAFYDRNVELDTQFRFSRGLPGCGTKMWQCDVRSEQCTIKCSNQRPNLE